MLQCYICQELVEPHKYTRHVASHLAGNVTEMEPHALPAFSNYDRPSAVFPAHSTPPRSNPQECADGRRQAGFTPSHSPYPPTAASHRMRGQPNAFQTWLNNYAYSSPRYTTIDGEKSDSDSEVRQAAEVLRATTKEEIVKIVKAFEGFSRVEDQKTCLELVRKAPIFPGLVAYIYTHLIVCASRGWLRWVYNDDWSDQVSELKQLVDRWEKYERPWCILSCEAFKAALLKILCATKLRPGEHKCNTGLLNGTMVTRHDILNLAALAVLCITGQRKQDILGKPGGEVGKLIELFHNLLESGVELEECYRRCFLNVLIPFSRESGRCPRGFYITEGAISDLERKSRGGFGEVSKGKLDSCLVAVKALRRNGSMSLPEYTKCLSEEAIVWWYLRHPNCLPLYGIYVMPTEGQNMSIALVSPWMDQGTLSDYLKRNPSANRTKLILDVVRGLNYLHTMEPHVAHRDIKPDNILITRKGHACLADFGLASVFDTNDDLHTPASQVDMGGTPNYMAPEIFDAKSREEKRQVNKRACDMYALGCTIYAAYMGKPPFGEMLPAVVRANVTSGRRPEFPVGKIPQDMWSFIEKLWDPEPSRRLTAEMALNWMEVKTSQEGVDPGLAPLGEDEWERKGRPDGLWSVSF